MLLLIIIASAIILIVAYLTYGSFLAKKVFKLDNKNETPAVEYNDGNDFVPIKKGMLLGQQFSAIAAAGPINGPIIAATMFGWAPAIFWVILGSIFIGGVHDMGALVASVRNKAKSITDVIRMHVSKRAWYLFMLFIWIALVYIIVAFTDITASSFAKDVDLGNGEMVAGGAIATSSLLYLVLPMIMGLLMRFGKLKEGIATAIFLPLVGVAIWVGRYIPLSLGIADPNTAQKVWGLIILAYCFIAAIMPMWLVLQPRGALGGYFLYAALLVAAIGLMFGGFKIQYPAFTPAAVAFAPLGQGNPMFPVLFITIACGACSGFHALVSSGTTSKQLYTETDAKPIGYGAMLLEGMVAMISIACVMIIAADDPLTKAAPNFIYARGIGRFMELIGVNPIFGVSFGLMAFTTFVYDTLDVCTRLGRYIIEELTGWKDIKGKVLGTILTAGVPIIFLFQTFTVNGKVVSAWSAFWGTFGASNQLLAALALIGITVWLIHERKGTKLWLVPFIPAVLMFIMSNWALLNAIFVGWFSGAEKAASIHPAVPFVSLILMVLSILVAVETVSALAPKKDVKAAAAA